MHIFNLDVKNAFEIVDRDQPKAVFTCKTEEEKNEWMSVLMTIYMRRLVSGTPDHEMSEATVIFIYVMDYGYSIDSAPMPVRFNLSNVIGRVEIICTERLINHCAVLV